MKRRTFLSLALALGMALSLLPAAALAAPGAKDQLAGISYSGDRSATTMTADQATAILAKIDSYVAAAPTVDYPVEKGPDVYATLFDTGAGVPGLFLAKGYCIMNDAPFSLSGGQLCYDIGEAEIWSFRDGALVPLHSEGDDFALYPACVALASGSPDGAFWETRYHALGGGTLSDTPTATLVVEDDFMGNVYYYAGGEATTYSQYQSTKETWEKGGVQAAAAPGGGVEYIIQGMSPAGEVTAALQGFIAALSAPPPMSYASTQTVAVDGKAVEFQMYALKDENGNLTNYIKVRDLAAILNGTTAQFEVGYYSNMVHLVKGWAYTPNGSEMTTPFSGDRPYTKSAAQTNVDGINLDLGAITLTDDNGGGYTYYQLRDLGKALGFNVGWSQDKGVFIETGKPYTDAD